MSAADDIGTAAVAAPGWIKLALESRAPLELAASLATWPLWSSTARGDGHPVLVIPGFIASDLSTRPLRQALRLLGHDVHGWDQGRNLGPKPGVLDAALARIRELHAGQGRKVSLVGWSLGGIYARELAKRAPDIVRCVVTLGTPFAGSPRATNAWRLYSMLNPGQRPRAQADEALRAPPPVPTTSIFSRSDGIVAWQSSVEQAGPMAESIEVEASHVGMGVNPLVLHALADRLALPEGRWRPFERTGLKRFLFRDPQRPEAQS